MDKSPLSSEFIEKALGGLLQDWIKKNYEFEDLIPMDLFLSKAREIADQCNFNDFKVSRKWIKKICEQVGLKILAPRKKKEEKVMATESAEASWRNWCRCCGSCVATMDICQEFIDLVVQYFNVQPDPSGKIKLCSRCCFFLSNFKALIIKSQRVSQMFELLPTLNMTYSTPTALDTIREEFGLRPAEDCEDLEDTYSSIEEDTGDDGMEISGVEELNAVPNESQVDEIASNSNIVILVPCELCKTNVNRLYMEIHMMICHPSGREDVVDQQPEQQKPVVNDNGSTLNVSEPLQAKVEMSPAATLVTDDQQLPEIASSIQTQQEFMKKIELFSADDIKDQQTQEPNETQTLTIAQSPQPSSASKPAFYL